MAQVTILVWVFSPLLVYVVFFLLARRPTAIRCSRIGKLIVLLITFSTLLTFVVAGSDDPLNWPLTISCLVAGICLWPLSQIFLVRLATDQFQELVHTGSARLLLACETTGSRHVSLTGRTRSASIRSFPVAPRILIAVMPAAHPRDKITLLIRWLPKVLPGPLPRLRIVLKKKSSS
jgi:hypothetical protein